LTAPDPADISATAIIIGTARPAIHAPLALHIAAFSDLIHNPLRLLNWHEARSIPRFRINKSTEASGITRTANRSNENERSHHKKGAIMKKAAVARNFVTVLSLFAFLIVLTNVRADEWNQATLFTFNQPVQIPGQVLPAGTYLFEIVNNFNHEIVRISNADRTNVIAFIQARPATQKSFNGKSAIVLAGRGSSQPPAVIAWSYAGRLEGHQLLYPKQMQTEVAKDKQDTFVGD
jgi:hypothetical protein